MTPEIKVQYQYWTGTQWQLQEIYIGPPMSTGWHIFHVVMTLLTWGMWSLVYLTLYLNARSDKVKKTVAAHHAVDLYYQQLDEIRQAHEKVSADV